jgi:hypothetical protein
VQQQLRGPRLLRGKSRDALVLKRVSEQEHVRIHEKGRASRAQRNA